MFTLGVVPYLNAVPLVVGLRGRAELVEAVPSQLTAVLAERQVDAALLPVAESIGGVGEGYLGSFGITSEGIVRSVLLFLRKPLADVRTVTLDPASRTSAGLARHVLREAADGDVLFDVAPEPGPDPRSLETDAVLVIGDPALRHGSRWRGEVMDLGELWTEATGLPFVYARWTAREGLAGYEREGLARLLDEVAERGVTERETLARAWAEERGQDPDAAASYVRDNVGYRIGAREEEGLAHYAAILLDGASVEAP